MSELLFDSCIGANPMPPLAHLFASERTPKTGAYTVGSVGCHIVASLPPPWCLPLGMSTH